MKLSYDLHIHSCLSPCGDEDMLPSNIVGMAALKELEAKAEKHVDGTIDEHSIFFYGICKDCAKLTPQ